MNPSVPLSSKLAVTAGQGFALRQSRQPHYCFDWHMHDCAMLLWPQLGALDSRWVVEPGTPKQSLQLVRHTALLLPPSAAHSTRSRARRQRHGELYLRPELLGRATNFGVVQLDSAAFSILEALAAPTLGCGSGEFLVQALVAQLAARQPMPADTAAMPDPDARLSQRMLGLYADALEEETGMPTVEVVAQTLGVSTRQLQRACAVELGTSPVAIRRQLMATKARELLACGTPLGQVSQQLCFSHSGHLTRLLREVVA